MVQFISPEYFATLKIPLLSGRLWTEDENRRADFVAIVNQTFAQRYLPKRDALNLQIRTDGLKDDVRPLAVFAISEDEYKTGQTLPAFARPLVWLATLRRRRAFT